MTDFPGDNNTNIASSSLSAGNNLSVNSNNVHAVINVNTDLREAQEKVKKRIDPFTSLDLRSEDIINFDYIIDDAFIEEVIKKRILLLECPDSDYLNSIYYQISKKVHTQFSHLSLVLKQYIPSEAGAEGANEYSIDRIFMNPDEEYNKQEQKQLLVAKIVISNHGVFFFESLLKIIYSKIQINQLNRKLSEQNIILVFFFDNLEDVTKLKKEDVVSLKHHSTKEPLIIFKSIPFLSHLLKDDYQDEQCLVVQSKLEKQRKEGKWSKSDIKFYNEVTSWLRLSPEERSGLLHEKDAHNNNKETEEILEKVYKQFEEPQKRIFQSIYFAGVFFPKLKLREFTDIVCYLLDGESYIVLQPAPEISDDPEKSKQVYIEKIHSCADEWKADIDRFIRLCFLQPAYTESDQQTIEFKRYYLRSRLKKLLEEEYPSFIQNQFNKLFDPVFINTDSSGIEIENFIEFSIEMAKSDPYFYGSVLLHYIRKQLNEYDKIEDEIINTGKQEEQEVLAQNKDVSQSQLIRNLILAQGNISWVRSILMNRLSYLLREMIGTVLLEPTQRQFLNSLIELKNYGILLQVIKRLYHIKEFDTLKWLKQLICRGNDYTKKEAYIFLIRLLGSRTDQTSQRLQDIYHWIPENPPKVVIGSDIYYNIMAIFHLSIWSFYTVKEQEMGKIPSAYSLFTRYGSVEEAENDFNFLFGWLFHKGVYSETDGLRTEFYDHSDQSIDAIQNPFDLLKTWYIILNGFEKCPSNEYAKAYLHSLAIFCQPNKRLKKDIREHWLNKREFYAKAVREIPFKEREELKKAKKQWRLIDSLLTNFKIELRSLH